MQLDNGVCELQKMMEKNDQADVDYIKFLMCTLTEDKKSAHTKNRKDIVDDIDDSTLEECDPQYVHFLKALKTHGKSYVLEHEKLGLPVVIKYEGDSDSDEECEPQPQRRLRSATRKEYEIPTQMPAVENQSKPAMKPASVNMTKNQVEGKSRSGIKKQKVEMFSDTEYLTFIQSCELAGDYFVYKFGGKRAVYEMNRSENCQDNWKLDSEHSSSDVEILESPLICNDGNLNSFVTTSTEMNKVGFQNPDPFMQSEFRQELINLLRKPYNEEEYHKLWREIKVRKPEIRHLDLRGGRQLSYSTSKAGKSYLDRFSALKRCISKIDDKPKRLNLLRGFFFWLQKSPLEGSFFPWIDEQCLSISPESESSLKQRCKAER